MSAVKQQLPATFTDPFAPVQTAPVSVGGEEVASKVAIQVRADRVSDDPKEKDRYVTQAILGRDYQLLPNRKVRDIADDIMSRSHAELGGFENIKTLYDGKRYVDYFTSNNPIARYNGNAGAHTELKLGLMVWNAYDGTRKTGFEIFALDPYCTNQFHSRVRFGFFAWRHVPGEAGQIDADDALQGISTGVQSIIRIAPRINELKKLTLTTGTILQAKAAIKLPQTKWGDVLDALGKEKGNDGNAFGLYQALTNVASHKLSGMSSIDVGSTITDHFLKDDEEVMNHTTAGAVTGASMEDRQAVEVG